jgi:hypothetical protein
MIAKPGRPVSPAGGPILFPMALDDQCSTCKVEFPFALARCPGCRKSVCENCAHRMGGSTFCGVDCANSFFFGGQEDVEDESDLHLLDDDDGE